MAKAPHQLLTAKQFACSLQPDDRVELAALVLATLSGPDQERAIIESARLDLETVLPKSVRNAIGKGKRFERQPEVAP